MAPGLFLALAMAAPLGAQGPAVATAGAPPPASAPAAGKEPPTLSEIVVAASRADALKREVEAALASGLDVKAVTAPLAEVESRVEEGLRLLHSGELSNLRFDTLVDVDARIRDRERTVGEATRSLGAELARLERDMARLDREVAAWPGRVQTAVEREAPAEILDRAKSIGSELVVARETARKRRDEVLLAFDRGTRLLSYLDTLRIAVASRRDAIGRQLRTAEEAPIWADARRQENQGVVRAEFALARQMLADYVRDELLGLLVALTAIGALVSALLRRPLAARTSVATRAGAFAWPEAVAGGLLVAFVTIAFFAPTGPTAFYPLWWFPVPWIAAWVASRVIVVDARATLWALAAAGSFNTFNMLADLEPGAGRLLLVAQAIALGAAVLYDWRRRALDRQLARLHPITVRMLVIGELVALVAAILASVVGFTGLARTLRGVAITATSGAMVFVVTALIVDRALAALLDTAAAQRLRGVREQGDAVLRFLRAVVALASVGGYVVLLVYTQNLVDAARGWVASVGAAKISVRDVDVSAGGIVLGVLIVLATAVLIRLVRFLLTVEILPRFGLRPGVPYAIATLTGYALAILGVVLALAAIGIDLTKVTLLAGALGVGIGFGLQNVVNNFVSGLILVLERPVKVGDQVAIGDLVGDVRRIGIRSSTVRTVQGAEVIVPNSDLVSKQVVNWTLSDRSRRYEIDVGVAYGSDVDRVLALLESAAAGVPEVRNAPPPRVLFAGFGESSLDFRVLAWVESIDVGLQAQTNLRRAILAALTGAGIEIPFPQRDLHVRTTAPPAATGAADGTR